MHFRRKVLISVFIAILVGVSLLQLTPAMCAQAPQSPGAVPDHVAYKFLFHHVVLLKQRSDRASAAGQNRTSLRSIVRREAGLNEAEGDLLEKIALECDSQIEIQNAKAKKIIEEIHARYPFGIYNPSFPPLPDPRLSAMQQERENMILSFRDRLRASLGEDAFMKLDAYVKRNVRNSTHITTPDHE